MSGALDKSRWISMTGLCVAVVVLLFAGSARAAGYPSPGGNSFSGGAEGWAVKSAGCNLILCSATGGYDGAAGNPAGSLAANSNITLGLAGLFSTSVVLESPNFKVGDGGTGTLSMQRQYVPGGLAPLIPTAEVNAFLVDKTAGSEAKVITETLGAASGFTGKEGQVPLAAGHTYAIKLVGNQSGTVTIGLTGASILRFDNVSLTGPGSNGGEEGGGGGNGGDGGNGGNGGAGGNGANGLTDSRLTTLMQSSLVGPAAIKGKRMFVKAKCPAKVGRACKITVQGLLKKGKPATTKRTAKVAKGKAKQLVLKVKPAVKGKVAGRKNLLFKEEVKAGSAKATVWKRLKLIKR